MQTAVVRVYNRIFFLLINELPRMNHCALIFCMQDLEFHKLKKTMEEKEGGSKMTPSVMVRDLS